MDRLTFLEVIFFSIPEAIVITSIAFGIAGIRSHYKKNLYIGTLTGIILYFLRPLANSYIVNVMIYIGVLIALFILFKVTDIFRLLASIILAVSIYLIIEFLNVSTIQFLFNVDPVILLKNYIIRFICFIPQISFAALISFLIRRYKLSIFTEA